MHLKRRAKAATLQAASNAVRLPWGRAIAGQMLHRLRIGFEPPSEAVGYPGGAEAAACVSIDFDANSPERLAANREGTYALVELSEEHGIPLTWAICGKTAEQDMRAYHRLLDSAERKEIGVHTYSHLDVSRASEEQVRDEVLRCVGALGLRTFPSTFVFPWNREGHFELLRRMGFTAYRGARRVIGAPSKRNGLWNIPPVFYVDHNSIGAGALIGRYIDACVQFRSVFHLWLHPWSLVERGDLGAMLSTTMGPVFEHMGRMRDEGRLSASTMGELSACMEGDGRGIDLLLRT